MYIKIFFLYTATDRMKQTQLSNDSQANKKGGSLSFFYTTSIFFVELTLQKELGLEFVETLLQVLP